MPGSTEKIYRWWLDANAQRQQKTTFEFVYLFCVSLTTGCQDFFVSMLMKLFEPPPPSFMHTKYPTQLHKLFLVVWYSQFMWLGSSAAAKVTQDDEMDRETDAVMRQRVADSTRGGYNSRNVSFMIWLFDSGENYHHLLEPCILSKMEESHARDKARRTKKGKPCKLRDYLREACLQALLNIDPSDPESMPVQLEMLNFIVFTRYLSTFKRLVNKTSAKKRKQTNEKDFVLDAGSGKVETIRLSPSSFDGACSALAHLFTECGIYKETNTTSKELWTKLSAFKKGTRRLSAKERKELGLSTVEGKKPLPFKAYQYMAKILFESKNAEHIAAHTFLLLEWNLISRAEYVVGSMIDSVSFSGDAFLFDIGVTKTDQEGTRNVDHPWHVYANPEDPYICPFLAMARHLMNNPLILGGKRSLFEGSSQYERFNKIFNEIIHDPRYSGEFVALGIPPEHFGTHSIRKGAVTHIATGTTSCPPIASICLRANWAMPGVMN